MTLKNTLVVQQDLLKKQLNILCEKYINKYWQAYISNIPLAHVRNRDFYKKKLIKKKTVLRDRLPF